MPNQTCQSKANLATQAYWAKPTKPNPPIQTKLLGKAVEAWVHSAFGNVLSIWFRSDKANQNSSLEITLWSQRPTLSPFWSGLWCVRGPPPPSPPPPPLSLTTSVKTGRLTHTHLSLYIVKQSFRWKETKGSRNRLMAVHQDHYRCSKSVASISENSIYAELICFLLIFIIFLTMQISR